MYSEKQIIYTKPTSIYLWNLYKNNIFAYFIKRFCSYLSKIGLSCHPFGQPLGVFGVKNSQSTDQFIIHGIDEFYQKEKMEIEEHYLNFDLNHLIFFDITNKEKEFNVLSEFNEILKMKNKSNENLEINERNETNISYFLNPSFFLILYILQTNQEIFTYLNLFQFPFLHILI